MKAKWIGLLAAGLAVAAASTAFAKWDDWVELPRLRAGMLGALKDPGSATYRNERMQREYVCGEVNARNSLGGYTGFVRYVSTPTRYALEEHGGQGWIPDDDTAAIVRRIERTTAFLRVNKRQPTQEEDRKAEFEHIWSAYCTL